MRMLKVVNLRRRAYTLTYLCKKSKLFVYSPRSIQYSKDFTLFTHWQDLFIPQQSQLSCEHTTTIAAIQGAGS